MTAPDLSPGRIIAQKYAVQGVLAKRPFAVTYEALTAPNRLCAVKLWDPAILRHPSALSELRDCEALARELPDGTTITIIDSGIDPETNAPFTATLLSDHPSLRAMVELCPLDPIETASMLRSLARSLDAAHKKDLLHLNLRPENVFVGPPPVCWTRPSDFGADIVERTLAPEHNSWMVWASPEQIAMQTISPQSDVYAAGLVAYFAMTGKHLFGIERASRIDKDELARRHRDAPPRVSEAGREAGVEIPPALDVPFQKALSPSPLNRYPTVLAFAEAIARALDLPATAGASAFVDHLVGARESGEPIDGPRSQELTPSSAPPAPPAQSPQAPAHAPRVEAPQPHEHESEPPPSIAHALVVPSPTVTERQTVPDAPASKGVSLNPPPADTPLDYRPPIQVRALPSARKRNRTLLLGIGGAILGIGGIAIAGAFISAERDPAASPVASAPAKVTASATGTTERVAATTTAAPTGDTPPPVATVAATTPPPTREIIPGVVWYGEIVVRCDPSCETVLIQGGLVPNNQDPKRMPPGTYSITVRQQGLVKSQTVPLRASERLTVTFDKSYAPPPQYFNPRPR